MEHSLEHRQINQGTQEQEQEWEKIRQDLKNTRKQIEAVDARLSTIESFCLRQIVDPQLVSLTKKYAPSIESPMTTDSTVLNLAKRLQDMIDAGEIVLINPQIKKVGRT